MILPIVNGVRAAFRDARYGDVLITRTYKEGTRLVSHTKCQTLIRVRPGTKFRMTNIPQEFAADNSLDCREEVGCFLPTDSEDDDDFNLCVSFDRLRSREPELLDLPENIKVEIVWVPPIGKPGGTPAKNSKSEAA